MARKKTLTAGQRSEVTDLVTGYLELMRLVDNYTDARALIAYQDDAIDLLAGYRKCDQLLEELLSIAEITWNLLLLRFPGYYTAHTAAARALRKVK